jgi:pentatricopeptide repeat protein
MQDFDGLEPNTQTYSMVLHAWAQCEAREQRGAAAQRAENILAHMTQLYSNGADVKPNAKSFTTCIAAWSRCDAPERAQSLLERLLDLHEKTKDPELRPDTPAGNAVVIAWSRSQRPDSAFQTKQALAKLEEFAKPDLISYNCLLHAYSRDANVGTALELLEWLEHSSELEPDAVSYNSVLNALAKSQSWEAALQAEGLLEKMEDLAKCGRPNVQPTSVTYTSVVNAWSNSKGPSPSQPAYRIYQRFMRSSQQIEKGPRPDIVFFVSLIQAFAKEQEKKPEALTMAREIFEEITACTIVMPNEVAFVAMIDACNRLSSGREEWLNLVTYAIKKCQESGFLSRRVLATLRRGATKETLLQILGSSNTTQLPKGWSRRVPKQHQP